MKDRNDLMFLTMRSFILFIVEQVQQIMLTMSSNVNVLKLLPYLTWKKNDSGNDD